MAHSGVPALWQRFLPPAFEAGNYSDRPAEANAGTVLEPQPGRPYAVHGDWRGERRRETWRALGASLRGLAGGLKRGAGRN